MVGAKVEECRERIRNKDVDDQGDLPIREAALRAECVVEYLLRAVDDKGEKLAQELVLSNCIALIGAGFVTSASLLSWCLYALVTYPGTQERLLEELVDSKEEEEPGIGDGEPTWSYSTLASLPFLNAFIKETLRLHGPSFQSARTLSSDTHAILPGGFLLPPSATIIPSFPHIHTNADVWGDTSHLFQPDRWTTTEVKERHRAAFIPFAMGLRGCVGREVALAEIRLALAHLVHRYRWVAASEEPLEYDPEFLVVRPVNVFVRVLRRDEWPLEKGK